MAYKRGRRMNVQHFDSVTIDNYRCFEHFEVKNLAQFNLLGGLNGIGKSTFLEAIFHLVDRGNATTWMRPYSWRGLPLGPHDNGVAFESIFHNGQTSVPVKIAGSIGKTNYAVQCQYGSQIFNSSISSGVTNTELNSKSSDVATIISVDGFKHIATKGKTEEYVTKARIGIGGIYFEIDKNILTPMPRSSMLNYITRHSHEDISQKYTDIVNAGRVHELMPYLHLVNENIRGLEILLFGGQPVLHAKIENDHYVPLPFLGEGAVSITSAFLSLAFCKNGVVLLDELDAAVHHSNLRRMWKLLAAAGKAFNVQIFAATHSEESLEAFIDAATGEGLIDKVSFTRIRKNKKGFIEPVSYSGQEVVDAIAQEWEVR